MEEMQQELDSFIEKMKHTEIYKEYERQKELMKERPELKRQIDEFRQRNFELQNSGRSDNLYEETERFQRENEAFREIPGVNEFLSAELALCRMVQGITKEILESVAVDFD